MHNSNNKSQTSNDNKMNLVKIAVALLTAVLIMVMMTLTINKYETHLAEGDVVLLKLASVDPRGFMQGDYMALRFAIASEIRSVRQSLYLDDQTPPKEGYVVVTKDAHNVGHFDRLIDKDEMAATSLADDEMALYYRERAGVIRFATNAFFFQEGHAEAYESAEYGMFRVNDQGEPLLTNMVDSEFEVIGSEGEVIEVDIY